MQNDGCDVERLALRARLEQHSAAAWVAEVDRLAREDDLSVDEALTRLAARFSGTYLDTRRHLALRLLEYLFLAFEPDAWREPLRYALRRGAGRRARNAAA